MDVAAYSHRMDFGGLRLRMTTGLGLCFPPNLADEQTASQVSEARPGAPSFTVAYLLCCWLGCGRHEERQLALPSDGLAWLEGDHAGVHTAPHLAPWISEVELLLDGDK